MVPPAAVLGDLALHVGTHAGETSAAFEWWYVAASVGLVGGVGGLLYWYYGERDGGP